MSRRNPGQPIPEELPPEGPEVEIHEVPPEVYEQFEDDYSQRLSKIIAEDREARASHNRVELHKYRFD